MFQSAQYFTFAEKINARARFVQIDCVPDETIVNAGEQVLVGVAVDRHRVVLVRHIVEIWMEADRWRKFLTDATMCLSQKPYFPCSYHLFKV